MKRVGMEKMIKAVKGMANKSSMGDDDIPQDLFKLIILNCAPVFLKIVNLSIVQQKFPEHWKISRL